MPDLSKRKKKWLARKLVEIHMFCLKNNIEYMTMANYAYENYADATYRIDSDSGYKSVTLLGEDIKKVIYETKLNVARVRQKKEVNKR